MARTREKTKGRRSGTVSFAGIPRHVMEHTDYIGLSANAIRLLLELAFQYRGHNNGDLTAAWTVMKTRGFRSKATLQRALEELLSAGMIERSREGRFLNPGGVCALYALTWQPVDECRGKNLELKATTTPKRRFDTSEKFKLPGTVSGEGSPQKRGRLAA